MSTELVPLVSAVLTVSAAMTAPATPAAARTSTGTSARGATAFGTTARGTNSSNTIPPGSNVSGAVAPGANVAGTVPRAASVWGTTIRGASVSGTTTAAKPELTAEQKLALKHLHETAQQFESLFVNMLFKSMRAASPQTSITGEKLSPAETTFTEMLDEKRSESMAQTGAFGIAKVLEDQLKASVLANPAQAAKSRVAPDGIL